MAVLPAKTQISLGIRPVWSESSLSTWRNLGVLSYPLSAQRRLWSDWADAQADLSLRWADTHFVDFVMSQLMLVPVSLGLLSWIWWKLPKHDVTWGVFELLFLFLKSMSVFSTSGSVAIFYLPIKLYKNTLFHVTLYKVDFFLIIILFWNTIFIILVHSVLICNITENFIS